MTCDTTAKATTTSFSESNYDSIATSIQGLFTSMDQTCTENTCPRADFAGCVLRIAGHDLMDFRKVATNFGGSDGCINFDEADNKGLTDCSSSTGTTLRTVYQTWCS